MIRFLPVFRLVTFLLATASSLPAIEPANPAKALTADLAPWSIEQMPGGTVTTRDGALHLEDAAGVTIWLRQKLTAPIEITYDATVVAAGGPHDRLSDLNCFWMAHKARKGKARKGSCLES